jgi:lysophospholipase L1-like esterase
MAFYPFSAASVLQRPVLYYPQHLRRWRAALALADQGVVPLVYAGDSIPWGIGADNTTTTSNATALAKGICGRLQNYFADSPRSLIANPGEGYVFPNDSRITVVGTPVQNNWGCTPQAQGYRLIGTGQNLTITVPTGVTSISVIQGNCNAAYNTGGGTGHSSSGLADVTCLYSNNGGANTNLSALTNTNQALASTPIAVTAGTTFEVLGPASAQGYINGFILNTAAATGVQVHRVCLNGAVSGRLLGGQTTGVLNLTAAADQVQAAQSCYIWNPVPSCILVQFSVNDQQFQNGGGVASQNGVTIALYQQWIQQFCNQAVSDGWCVLLVAGPQDQGYNPGYPTLDQYLATLKSVAATTDHVAFVSVSEMWGPYASSQADGIQLVGSVHPNQAGHGDVAAMLIDTLYGKAQAGITELTSG